MTGLAAAASGIEAVAEILRIVQEITDILLNVAVLSANLPTTLFPTGIEGYAL